MKLMQMRFTEINELTTYNSSLKLNGRRRRRRKESVFAGKKHNDVDLTTTAIR